MIFRSEKKELKKTINSVIDEKVLELEQNAESLRQREELTEDMWEMEFNILKKRHLDGCLDSVIQLISLDTPEIAENVEYLMMDPGSCGYELDFENGLLAGGIYAITYFAKFQKTASPADCAELNKRHAVYLGRIMHG